MAHVAHNPADVAQPNGLFSAGLEVAPGARWLAITGQVGVDVDGVTAATIDEQCTLAWRNVVAILHSAGMTTADLVQVNAYVTDPSYIEPYRAARDPLLTAPYPASTVLVVAALADPSFLIEIDGLAAAP